MGNSLFDQLKKSGLVDEKKAQKIKKEKHKQKKQKKGQKKGEAELDESKQLALQAQAEKAERDRELNRQRLAEQEKIAIKAQIKQLIESNTVTCEDEDIRFNFSDQGKVQRLYVNTLLQQQLTKGQLAIVSLEGRYRLVPTKVANKISLRDEQSIIFLNEPTDTNSNTPDEDDPYADYQIPDDLMW